MSEETKISYINISCKHSDLFSLTVFDDQGNNVLEHDGYAPGIPGVCRGDYTDISIDNETGKIKGWVPIDLEKLKEQL